MMARVAGVTKADGATLDAAHCLVWIHNPVSEGRARAIEAIHRHELSAARRAGRIETKPTTVGATRTGDTAAVLFREKNVDPPVERAAVTE